MDEVLKWLSEYSMPVVLLICFGAALVFVLKLITERTIERQFHVQTRELELKLQLQSRELELKLERRSEFEQEVLRDRYRLVCEFGQRLSQITTNLNRANMGKDVEGLFDGHELVPLTSVFEDLAAKRFQLSTAFHALFFEQAGVVLAISNARTAEERETLLAGGYLRNLEKITALAQQEFRTDKLPW